MMTVAELIAFLNTLPQDILVAYSKYSEQCLLEKRMISVESLCAPRADGWIQASRPDKPTQLYLLFPGN